ncbi:MAG: Rpn family recombination-promoting nuclease/putative transposase, partial [Prevotellaceae bacterium]|nr:Rpn family recombination-promoting nuclease/putative transposase [Candidatus Colivivens equi]
FIDLRCDFGFKYCMSDPIIMMSFLNAILDGDEETITDVSFENVEMPRETEDQRGVIFDLLCTTDKGDTILIEMQNSNQKFFKTRANFYTYNLLRKKIERGHVWKKMKHDISKIIGIFIMGEGLNGLDKVITRTAECDLDTGGEFWDRHRKYFISLPKFTLDVNNMTTKDIWIDFLKNLGSMDRIHPSVYKRADEGLLRLLKKANIAALSDEEINYYEASMKRLEDEMDMEEVGFERGVEVESLRIASDMKKKGFDFALIHELTNVSLDVIEKL